MPTPSPERLLQMRTGEPGDDSEEALQVRQLAEFPEANPFPVLRCDDSGRILCQNPAARNFAEHAGFAEKGIRGFLPAGFSEKVRRLIDEGRSVIDEEWRSLGRILSLTYRPITGMHEIFVFVVDVTERVAAVQQCQSYASELEAINRQLRDTRAELVQSEKMASLGNLSAGIAHEINSPLGALNANSQTVALAASKIADILRERWGACGDEETTAVRQFLGVITQLSEADQTAIARIRKIERSSTA